MMLSDQKNEIPYNIFQFCFYVTILSNLVIYIAMPLNIVILETFASRCFILCNLVSIFFVINSSIKQYMPYKTSQINTIILMICFSTISFLLSSSGGIYNYIIRLLCYLALPFYFIYIDYLKPNRKMMNFIFTMNFLISLIFTLLSVSKYNYAGYEHFLGTKSAWLTLGYDNPNQTAMYLLITLIILYCTLYFYKKKWVQNLIFIDIIYMFVLLLKTSSRTCIIIAVLLTVIIIFRKKYSVSPSLMIAVLLLPIVFMLIYPYLCENGWIYVFKFGGKTDYFSRSYIYSTTLSAVKTHFIFGDFASYQLANSHNGTLSVYASFGVIGLIFFYIYYFRAYFNIVSNGIKSKAAFISFIGLLAVFVHACTEGAFLIGGSMYAGSLSALIFLTKLDWEGVQ